VEALGEASSHDFETGVGSFGGTESTIVRNQEQHCGLLIDVLTGLGGASQEDQQPALFLKTVKGCLKR
jgi:hypothetical protein